MGRNWLTKTYHSDDLLNINGIDGCKGGWLVAQTRFSPVSAQHADHRLYVAENWEKAVEKADLVAVDMPIGLADFGKRQCDVLARKKLEKKRSSSVFPPPRRGMLRFETYADANRFGKEQGPKATHGGGLSKQAWNITPKIKEIDSWITPRRQSRVFEAHPELAFAALNGGTPLPPKKSSEGLQARRRLLAKHGFEKLTQQADEIPKRLAAPDDVLDAAALVLVCQRILLGQAICLSDPKQRDAKNLAMEIWY